MDLFYLLGVGGGVTVPVRGLQPQPFVLVAFIFYSLIYVI